MARDMARDRKFVNKSEKHEIDRIVNQYVDPEAARAALKDAYATGALKYATHDEVHAYLGQQGHIKNDKESTVTKKADKKESCGCCCESAVKLRPLDDRIVVKRLEAEEKTAGGIILPDNAKEKPQKGKVVAVGAGKLLDSGARATPDVECGDTVIFGKYSGTEVKVDGIDYLIMRESDILAKC